MFLDFLFKPKWQSKNPRTRRQAFAALDAGDPQTQALFCEALRSDPDPVIRQWLVRQVTDLDLLAQASANDADAIVRDHAGQRWRRLVVGSDGAGLDVEQRLAAIQRQENHKCLDFIARNARDPALRRAAMLKIDREALFGDMAAEDDDAELRLEAAQHIRQRSTLERVLKVAKNRDKRVRSLLQQRLQALDGGVQQGQELYRQLKQICVKLEAETALISERAELERASEAAARLNDVWRQTWAAWHGLDAALKDSEGLEERFGRAQRSFAEALEAVRGVQAAAAAADARQAQRRADLLAQLAQAEAAIEDVAGVEEPAPAQGEALRQLRQTLSECAETVRGWDGVGEIADRLAQMRQRSDALLDELDQYDAGRAMLVQIAADASAAEARPDVIAELERRLESVPTLRQWTWPLDLKKQAESAVTALRASVSGKAQAEQQSLDEFVNGVSELNELLDSGQSKLAATTGRALQDRLKGLSPELAQRLRRHRAYRRYQAAMKRIQELRDWQGWATTPLREALCVEMQQLVEEAESHAADTAYDFSAVAQKVRDARGRWQKLGAGEPDRAEGLWQQFNDLCERAYAPCQEYFDRQAGERRENAAKKQAVCAQLEEYYAQKVDGVATDQVDYAAVEKCLREAQREWAAIGSVQRDDHHALMRRYRKANEALRSVIQGERDRNRLAKERLVKRAAEVAEGLQAPSPTLELNDAISRVRELQDEWKAIGQAAGGQELWRRFRAACDVAFAERQARFDVKAQALRANLAQRMSFCQMLENMVHLEGEELAQAEPRVRQMEREWDTLGAVPKEDSRAIEKRFRTAVEQFDAQHRQWCAEREQRQRALLFRKSHLCGRVERQLDVLLARGSCDSTAVEEIKREWDSLTALPRRQESALQSRWDRAWDRIKKAKEPTSRAHVEFEWGRIKAAQRQAKRQLCIRMEVLAGVESPTDAREERLALQVAQLAEKMQQGGGAVAAGESDSEFDELLLQWCSMPVGEGDVEASLSARWERASEALVQGGSSGHAAATP
jgi:hypothetical protein